MPCKARGLYGLEVNGAVTSKRSASACVGLGFFAAGFGFAAVGARGFALARAGAGAGTGTGTGTGSGRVWAVDDRSAR